MSLLAILASVAGGFLLGNFVVAASSRWIFAMYEAWKPADASGRRSKGNLLVASLLSTGPWAWAAFAIFAYYVRSEAWAPWLFAGFGISMVFMGTLIARMIRVRNQALKSPSRPSGNP